MFRFSVIVPVYCVEDYIEESIKSIVSQNFRDFEVILVDDCSPDDSIALAVEILEESKCDYRVVFHVDSEGCKINKGLSASRNLGMREANSDWVICVDSDDCIDYRMLEIYNKVLCLEDVDYVSCDYQVSLKGKRFTEGDFALKYEKMTRAEMARAFYRRDIDLLSPSLMVRKDMLQTLDLGYPENCSFSEDAYFNWLLIASAGNSCRIKNKLYSYTQRSNSIMTASSFENMITGYNALKELQSQLMKDEEKWGFDKRLIICRWVLGCLHTASRLLSFLEFKHFCSEIDARIHMRNLARYGDDARTRFASVIYRLSPKLFYQLMKRM